MSNTNDSVFLANLDYYFKQTDGTYNWPSGAVGDLLKQAKKEIEAHDKSVKTTQIPVAEVVKGNVANRLQWLKEGYEHEISVGTQLYLQSDALKTVENNFAVVEREACMKVCQEVVDSGLFDPHQQYAAAYCRDMISDRSN